MTAKRILTLLSFLCCAAIVALYMFEFVPAWALIGAGIFFGGGIVETINLIKCDKGIEEEKINKIYDDLKKRIDKQIEGKALEQLTCGISEPSPDLSQWLPHDTNHEHIDNVKQ